MSSARTRNAVSKFGAIALIAASLPGAERPLEAADPEHGPKIVVTTAAELEAALSPANEGAQVLLRAGEYVVSHALAVPDGATLAGEGVMTFDESGLPAGFDPSGRTVLRSAPGLVGDILTLGDGATIRQLVIQDVARSVPPPQMGNPVVVSSRAPGDFVAARIVECEIDNANPAGIAPGGPTGRGLAVLTRNPNAEQDPPPHAGSVLSVRLERSIVRSPAGGQGAFAINFASDCQIGLVVERNVIGGEVDAIGGAGRPDAVTGSSVIIQSSRNLYRSDTAAPTALGWNLVGGADSPSPLFVSEPSTLNSLRIHSRDDVLEGFAIGISAIGGRRFSPLSGDSSSNTIDINLNGTRILTTTADLQLSGAMSLASGVSPGDGNTVRLLLRQATGSGPRSNLFADSLTPTMTDLGADNRLEIVGNENAFGQTNDGFLPAPPAEFFTGQR